MAYRFPAISPTLIVFVVKLCFIFSDELCTEKRDDGARNESFFRRARALLQRHENPTPIITREYPSIAKFH